MEESGEGSPAREHVVDRLGNRGMAREFGALGAHPVFQPGDQGGALFFAPRAQTFHSGQSIDLALDVKERVDAFDGLQSDRRDRRRILAAPRIGGDAGQLEELASRMAPAQRLNDQAGFAIGKIEAVVAVKRVGLQNAGIAAEMPLGMLSRSTAEA